MCTDEFTECEGQKKTEWVTVWQFERWPSHFEEKLCHTLTKRSCILNIENDIADLFGTANKDGHWSLPSLSQWRYLTNNSLPLNVSMFQRMNMWVSIIRSMKLGSLGLTNKYTESQGSQLCSALACNSRLLLILFYFRLWAEATCHSRYAMRENVGQRERKYWMRHLR